MGQVAFDTQEFVETLENAGLPKDQARAISIAVRKSHEVADVATRRDLEDAKKDIGARFDKVDAKFAEVKRDVAEVRKDLAFDIADARKEAAADMALLRKDVESLTNKMIIKMASIMVGAIGVATAIIKLL